MDFLWLDAYVGQLAGVGTSLLWTVTTLFFTAAGRRLGATIVNATRISFACVLLAITHRWLQGVWIPDVPAMQVLCLGASGVLGLAIGDQAIITAFVEIGPRLALLVTTTSPLWAALFGRIFLGERLPGTAWIGITMTLAGILWVLRERRDGPSTVSRSKLIRGVLLSLLAALCQSGGYLLSKVGMGHAFSGEHIEPQTATLLRMIFAAFAILPALGAQLWFRHRSTVSLGDVEHASVRIGRVGRTTQAAWRAGILYSLCGTVTGPYFGVWLSLIACDRAPLGIAQTLLTLAPVFILPATAVLNKERISFRALVGAALAVAGAGVLIAGKS